jgi:hypothetical protein
MSRSTFAAGAFLLTFAVSVPARAGTLSCPPDSVKVGTVCVDKYEASVWQIAPGNLVPGSRGLLNKIQAGKATLTDLRNAGATELSVDAPPRNGCRPAFPDNFPLTGQWTPVTGFDPPSAGVYALSIAGVVPTACITWFQAEQACALSGKRLLTNEEWQRAAAGTPDPGTDDGVSDCNTSIGINPTLSHPVATGSRAHCTSSWGVFDMIGNEAEWVQDWVELSLGCTDWTTETGIPGNDFSCFSGPGDIGGASFRSIPSALVRGGGWGDEKGAGVFSILSNFPPQDRGSQFGFRCAR